MSRCLKIARNKTFFKPVLVYRAVDLTYKTTQIKLYIYSHIQYLENIHIFVCHYCYIDNLYMFYSEGD